MTNGQETAGEIYFGHPTVQFAERLRRIRDEIRNHTGPVEELVVPEFSQAELRDLAERLTEAADAVDGNPIRRTGGGVSEAVEVTRHPDPSTIRVYKERLDFLPGTPLHSTTTLSARFATHPDVEGSEPVNKQFLAEVILFTRERAQPRSTGNGITRMRPRIRDESFFLEPAEYPVPASQTRFSWFERGVYGNSVYFNQQGRRVR